MFHRIKNFFKSAPRIGGNMIDPDEIFLDSKNLPNFNTDQFEGRLEKPISRGVLGLIVFFIVIIGLTFTYRLWSLQIVQGQAFRERSDSNNLRRTIIFANRGLIYDRNGLPLVWNAINSKVSDYSLRAYATSTGLSTLLGYIKYPTKDSNGFYYQNEFDPKDGD